MLILVTELSTSRGQRNLYTVFIFVYCEEIKKKAVIVSFRWDTNILTAARTAGLAAVCKAMVY